MARSRKILAIADNNSEVMNDVKRSWKVQQSYSNDSKIKQPVPRLNSARQALTRCPNLSRSFFLHARLSKDFSSDWLRIYYLLILPLVRLEDMVVAAIIALDGINGSSLDDLVLWIEVLKLLLLVFCQGPCDVLSPMCLIDCIPSAPMKSAGALWL